MVSQGLVTDALRWRQRSGTGCWCRRRLHRLLYLPTWHVDVALVGDVVPVLIVASPIHSDPREHGRDYHLLGLRLGLRLILPLAREWRLASLHLILLLLRALVLAGALPAAGAELKLLFRLLHCVLD